MPGELHEYDDDFNLRHGTKIATQAKLNLPLLNESIKKCEEKWKIFLPKIELCEIATWKTASGFDHQLPATLSNLEISGFPKSLKPRNLLPHTLKNIKHTKQLSSRKTVRRG